MVQNQAGVSDSTVYTVDTVYTAVWEVARGCGQFQHEERKLTNRGQNALVASSLEKYTVSTVNTPILPSMPDNRNTKVLMRSKSPCDSRQRRYPC